MFAVWYGCKSERLNSSRVSFMYMCVCVLVCVCIEKLATTRKLLDINVGIPFHSYCLLVSSLVGDVGRSLLSISIY